jgi:hypothetical protein
MKNKNEADLSPSEQQNIYNLNSFRGPVPEKCKLVRDIKPLPGHLSSRNMFSSEEKNKKTIDIEPKSKYKPKILTARLPIAFDINPKSKGKINLNVNNDDDSPKKLIKRAEEPTNQFNNNKTNKICFTEGQHSPEMIKNKKQVSKYSSDIKPLVNLIV